ncbi:polyprenyl synthetase family protein [Gammaproteobacteria bacterium]|jgi:geranylgeranyl pyrophosphate synthase|nr:polyprenyl synthetase family protein [Gammaproteobacteria bacterium]|tara:strand:- start:263 stop:1138 length:876 start_codon:yes stop_codon:yes gene_type:complete
MLPEYLSQVKKLVLNKIHISIGNSNLIEDAMSYSALANSKMIRAGLVFASSETNNNLHKDSVITMAAAVELMHTYSLIHDDLPCMDDDDLRRNQPSSHIKYGEANAVLAGDALQALAYEIICEDSYLDDSEKVCSIKILSKACGKNGMVYGQYLDIENENNKDIDQNMLDEIHKLKTGKLIECSVMLGQIGSDFKKDSINLLESFSKYIGLAFQITDDILDITQSEEILGKNKNSDIKNNKITYIDILGLDGAKNKAKELTELAINTLETFDIAGKDRLMDISKYLISRQN